MRLRSLPVPAPSELAEVRIAGGNGGLGVNSSYGAVTRPIWQQLHETPPRSFSGMFSWSIGIVSIGTGAEMEPARALRVSGDFFRVLGMQPWRGRLLISRDETTCPSTAAVVSYAWWQSHLGGRDLGNGISLKVNDELQQVIGVTPPGFFGLVVGDRFDVIQPFCEPKQPLRRDDFDTTVMGRLRPGATLPQASAELSALSGGIFGATIPTGYGSRVVDRYKRFRLAAYSASNGLSELREEYDTSLRLLLGITGLVLLLACGNIANLMLARAGARQRETAIRLALGASRSRILRQLLAESFCLAALGVIFGIALAQALSRVLVTSLSTRVAAIQLDTAIDWRVLLFTIGVASLTSFVFGVIPGLHAMRTEPASAMKSGSRGMTASRERFSAQRLMIIGQIALSLVLVFVAMLFVGSFRYLMDLDPGLREKGITVAFAYFEKSNIPKAQWSDFRDRLLAEVESGAGIESAATTTMPPLNGSAWGHGVRVGNVESFSMFTGVTPNYLQTMGIQLIAGRNFSDRDTATSPRVAIVNEAWVRRFLGNANPLGKTMLTREEPGFPATVYQIVGLMRDSRYTDIRHATPPMAFVPGKQYPMMGPWTAFMIHSQAASSSVMNFVKRRFASSHPEIVVETFDFRLNIQQRLTRERLIAMRSGFFGVLALLVAGIGLYGVISYIAAQRRNEIGIRMALGARRLQVLRMVIREAALLLIAGTAAGVLLSLAAGQSARSLLFGITASDPRALAGAAILLGLVALGAALLPARRAAGIDPAITLRYE